MLRTEILKKTEKIASAIYLITSFFPEKEPLKWQLRELSGRLISQALFIKDEGGKGDEKSVSEVNETNTLLQSLFMVAKNAGLVSHMNYEIFTKELKKLDAALNNKLPENLDIKLLSSHFFSPEEERDLPEPLPSLKDKISQAPHERQEKREDREIREKPYREYGAVAIKKNSRQSTIITLLKKKKEIMIKDVSPLIEGVSEKTIQRELLGMVKAGVLKKEGEKRWSRYSLAQ